MAELSKLFSVYAANHRGYQEALCIAQTNYKGDFWVIGGFVFRTLSHLINRTPEAKTDFDFLGHKLLFPIIAKGWKLKKTFFGEPRLYKGFGIFYKNIDLVSVPNIYDYSKPYFTSINGYLDRSPLTIQSIAYDPVSEKLLGKVGIESVLNRTIAIFCRSEYIRANYGVFNKRYLKRKAKGLNFKIIEPD